MSQQNKIQLFEQKQVRTVWAFRETLTKVGLIEEIFVQFITYLNSKELILNEGKIIDASFTVAPRQRNTPEENKIIKEGKGDELWENQPHKKSHKDIDARWTSKGGETFYGYKNHAKVDGQSEIIDTYQVTDAFCTRFASVRAIAESTG